MTSGVGRLGGVRAPKPDVAEAGPEPGPGPRRRAGWALTVLIVALVAAIVGALLLRGSTAPEPAARWRDHTGTSMFARGSWWSVPLPDHSPSHPKSARILDYLRTAPQSGGGFLRLSGAGDSPWGQPIYWAGTGDRTYDVSGSRFPLPPELRTLRIPARARPAETSDQAMTLVDARKGYVVGLWHASYDADADEWSAGGAQISYLASNGLDVRTGYSDDRRNRGSLRGNNSAVSAVRFDEVLAGSLDHVLKIAVGTEASAEHTFPMVGSDGGSHDPVAPPTGLRLRIAPSVDLDSLRLDPQALVIARAIQRYGVYIGDSAGVTALKLENTRIDSGVQRWTLSDTALDRLPFTPEFWQVLPAGYGAPRGRS